VEIAALIDRNGAGAERHEGGARDESDDATIDAHCWMEIAPPSASLSTAPASAMRRAALPLAGLFRRGRRRHAVAMAYHRIVTRARDRAFFVAWGVPDTLDGRFETLSLHAFLVLNRLKADHDQTAAFAQDLFDTMFADLDRSVREMGASDLGVGRHVKEMARGFYGRALAYEQGLAGGEAALHEALRRNLWGTAEPAPAQLAAVAHYVWAQVAGLAHTPVERLLQGEVPFAPLAAKGEQ
jgi:cytochrome b pre-mRNA-processing protein 3